MAAARALEQNSTGTLQTLYLCGNSLGEANDVHRVMARAKLQKLLGTGFNLDPASTAQVGDLVLPNDELKGIAEAKQAAAIETMFQYCEAFQVQRLNLHDSELGETGAAAVGRALEQNASLKRLGMSSNNLGKAGQGDQRRPRPSPGSEGCVPSSPFPAFSISRRGSAKSCSRHPTRWGWGFTAC